MKGTAMNEQIESSIELIKNRDDRPSLVAIYLMSKLDVDYDITVIRKDRMKVTVVDRKNPKYKFEVNTYNDYIKLKYDFSDKGILFRDFDEFVQGFHAGLNKIYREHVKI